MTKQRHDWTWEDNVVGLYLYRHGIQGLGMSEGEVLSRLASVQKTSRISEGSMERKSRNYQFLETGSPKSGSNASETSREVFDRYKNASKDDLLMVVRGILQL